MLLVCIWHCLVDLINPAREDEIKQTNSDCITRRFQIQIWRHEVAQLLCYNYTILFWMTSPASTSRQPWKQVIFTSPTLPQKLISLFPQSHHIIWAGSGRVVVRKPGCWFHWRLSQAQSLRERSSRRIRAHVKSIKDCPLVVFGKRWLFSWKLKGILTFRAQCELICRMLFLHQVTIH